MTPIYKNIAQCRVCQSDKLTPVLNLGKQHLQGSFLTKENPHPRRDLVPNEIVKCDECHLVQSSVTVDPKILYSNYHYQSSITETMREHLRWVAETAYMTCKQEFPKVLDIACNDGYLLHKFPLCLDKTGIDPSNVAKTANELYNLGTAGTFIHDLFPSDKLKGKEFGIITSIAVFYDLHDPVDFAKNVKKLLSKNGVWFLEVAYLPYIIERLSYDTILAEHIEHYSLTTIEYILKKAGLSVFMAKKTPTNGGSIFVGACHSECLEHFTTNNDHILADIRREEIEQLKLEQESTYIDFARRVHEHKDKLVELVKEITLSGKTIHLLGASTKGNVLVDYCELYKYIKYASERTPSKVGGETLSGIKIISEKESRAMKPSYYLVLPYHFKKEILEREKETRAKGTKFIFPLPEIEML